MTQQQEQMMWMLLLKPFFLFFLFGFTYFCSKLAAKHLPEGKIKRLLLRKIN